MDQIEGDPSDSNPPPHPIDDNQPPHCEAEESAVGAQDMEVESKQGDEAEDPSSAAADVDVAGEAVAAAAEVAEPSPDDAVKTVAGGKRKRGRPRKSQTPKQPVKKKENEEEEVCFICFDGGNLVCCDRRGCRKVYHAACVNRDEAFFQTKGKWNCGWHICSICEKAAQYMCYTCTYSLCRGCIKGKGFVCVRGNKGFCETCYGTVMLIESKGHANEGKVGINFDDKNSFECLFKEYWVDVKRRLSLSLGELENAKVPFKGSSVHVRKGDSSSDELYDGNDEEEASSDSSSGRREGGASSRKKVRRRSRATIAEESSSIQQVDNVEISFPEDTEWASKELLEFVAHVKGGDKSVLSQFDVQALLLEYIKQNNLRDPRRKSQIICDPRLENLFGKARVGHFEMLKLLESHFLIKEAPQVVTDDNQGGGVDPDSGQMDSEVYADGATKGLSDKRRKNRKKVEEREPQTNLDDYAAIDVHNIGLIYLRRNLMDDLLDDVDNFTEKVIGSFVRIRIPSTGQKQDMYRLVQVVGTSKAAEKYKTGRKTTDFVLEILNLNKKEVIMIDTVSNQDFTEEECKRLRQSIKCGLISRLTVGDIHEKAMALQSVRVNDWLESEKQRLGHLRDRASETGRRKELRECVEKLQLLSTPDERTRRLNEAPEIHSDPKMDPDNESVDEEESDDKNKDVFSRPRDSALRRGKDFLSPGRGGPSPSNWAGGRKGPSSARDSSRNARTEGGRDKLESFNIVTDRTNEPATWNQEKDVLRHNSWESGTGPSNAGGLEATVWNNNFPAIVPGPHGVTPEATTAPLTSDDPNETQKIWHYKDPAGKIQGPFSMVQLTKWNTTGYFPVDLKIWRASESEEDSVLLSDALMGKFEKDLPQWEPPQSNYSHPTTLAAGITGQPNEQGSTWRQNSSLTPVGNNSNSNIWTGTSNIERQNADSWASQSLIGSAPRGEVVIPREVRSGIPLKGWEQSRDTNAWSGQPQIHSSQRPVTPFHGNQYRPPLYQSTGVQGVGNAGSWNPGQDNRSNWGSSNPMMALPAGQVYGQQHANWGSSGQQSSNKNQWGNGSHTLPTPVVQPTSQVWGTAQGTTNVAASPMPSVQPMGTGWGTLNMPASPTPFQPMGTGWGTTSGAGINSGLQSAAAFMEQNRPAPGVNSIGGTAAWGLNSASTPMVPNQITGINPAHVLQRQQTDTLNVMENHSAVFPRNEVISPSNPSVLGFSTPTEHSSAVSKNQFFESSCPSPTLGSERQELPAEQLNELDTGKKWPEVNERLGSDPAPLSPTPGMSNRPSIVQSGALKLGYSSSVEPDPQDNMSPIRDTEAKPIPPSLITKPSDESNDVSSSGKNQEPDGQIHTPAPSGHGWEQNQTSKLEAGFQKPGHVDTGNLEGLPDTTRSDMWSLPSPTPATQPSGWNVGSVPPTNSQSVPRMSFDGPKLLPSSQSQAGSSAEQLHWGNMGTGPAKGDLTAGSGTTVLGSENMARGAPALGNANPSQGWGTWQEHMNMTSNQSAAEGSSNTYPGWGTANQNTGWGTGQEDTNGWSTQQNQSVDEYRGGHGRDSRYESRRGSYSLRDSDSRHDSRYGVDSKHGSDSRHHSRYGGDSRHDSRYGGDSRYDSRRDGGRGQRNDRMHRDRGGRSSRTSPRGEGQGQGICKFHESGHCKKGASCNYVHS